MAAREWRRLARIGVAVAAAGALPVFAAGADLALGRQIATQGVAGTPACITCHGARGEGAAAVPRLGGSGEAYLREQLEAFAAGTRQSPVMQPFAKQLSPDQRAAAAAYFAGLPTPLKATDKQATPADAGAWLATRGRWADQLPACAQCHGPGGSGVGDSFPPLAGLPATYIVEQLTAWRAGTRPPGPLGLMQSVAGKLTEADLQAVSTYYSALGQASTPPANQAARKEKP